MNANWHLPLKWLQRLLIAAASGYLIAAALLYWFQRDLIYHPSPELELPNSIQSLALPIDAGHLQLLCVNPGQPRALLYFGGNAEQVVYQGAALGRQFPQHSIYLLNYRGYGGSDGQPSESSLLSDALTSYDAIAKQPQHQHISVIGRSLGSGVASYLASQRPIDKLALITPYHSLRAVAQQQYPWLPIRWLLKDNFESAQFCRQTRAPILILLAQRDRVIPHQNSQLLIDSLPANQRQVATIAGSNHNTIVQRPEYYQQLGAFFESNLVKAEL